MIMLLEKLTGAKITGINHIYDYCQILTDKGTINIYVNSDISDSIVNCKIFGIEYDPNYIRFDFDNNQSVIISLDNPNSLPEYFSVYLNTGEIIAE